MQFDIGTFIRLVVLLLASEEKQMRNLIASALTEINHLKRHRDDYYSYLIGRFWPIIQLQFVALDFVFLFIASLTRQPIVKPDRTFCTYVNT
jgi:hypothetical protein